MGWQARDRLHWDIALGAAIAPPLLLLGLGLLPGLSPTAPATKAKAKPKVILWGAGDIEPQGS